MSDIPVEACGFMVGLGLCLGQSGDGLGGLCPCNDVLQPDLRSRPRALGRGENGDFFSGSVFFV